MATTKKSARNSSAMKRARQSEKRRIRNQAVKTYLKTITKKVEAALEQGGDSAKEALQQAIPAFNKAASKGVIHRNKASRKISRLTKKVNAVVNTSETQASTG